VSDLKTQKSGKKQEKRIILKIDVAKVRFVNDDISSEK
jgi:hypothetical protein